jgi:hypothetical protein
MFFISTLFFIDFNSINIFQKNHQFNINNNRVLNYQNSIKDDDIEIWSKSKSNTDNTNNNNIVNDATFFTICRNSDLLGIQSSIITVEERFNKNYHYPWVFANDEPFTEEFKKIISETVTGDVIFTTIPDEYWDLPLNIDKILLKNQLERLENDGVLYGGNLSYRKMCRFNSGFFYKLKALEKFNWYWRIEPDIKFSCDLNYDLFKIMKDNNKIYGFALAMTEDKRTVRKLWKESRNYFENLKNWKMNIKDGKFYDISNDKTSLGFIEQNTDSNELVRGEFNYCHYWTNFEIANLNFFRDEIYDNYFKSLDETGNFFYERWGDAPVHTIAVSYLLSDSQIQYFDNTGYYHGTIGNCPRDKNIFKDLHCTCSRNNDFSWKRWSCVPRWFKGLRKDPPHEVHY